ncbi:MAG: hypothetical protein K8S15_01045 [Candidatus Aegiribacteria sp.]|nr:hypothetical protein [Candidatus Aegiribacteria sp.]
MGCFASKSRDCGKSTFLLFVSRLVSYNCTSHIIENQLDLRGYPVDLEICPGGMLLALTAE